MKTKGKILDLLQAGDFVSGQTIATHLNISRSAVSQSISSLVLAGVEVHSVHGRGYRLVSPISKLCAKDILSELETQCSENLPSFIILEEVDSTNEYYKETTFVNLYLKDELISMFSATGYKDIQITEGNLVGYGANGEYKPIGNLEYFVTAYKK